ncbi:hypothetical protein GCM10011613_33970 [Cellvibrio zantedeschiae]|uniref:Restriction endonuclease type IV Mrr domain-containing protein n=1 Tax=Cellvibrio zantedeschiae TaxID=1237077 RepID=A0ABQ3B9L2_9GAMM|nr:restriction endonuclease [Cellvibrio zantedeschiae]GGY86125.1 hypothetical protein GCM10011613_33970 [Cellvibrio zantedeschiae]
MRQDATDFEIFIARVHHLLEGTNATVIWNEKIPDPNNPSQDRQIDIAVRKDGLFNIIECRHRKKKQDVNWIEELIGRRTSLNASSITAVSSSGFTKLAIIKARAHGVILSEIKNVPEEFILNWTRGMDIVLSFFRYESYKLKLFTDEKSIHIMDHNEFKQKLLAGTYIHDFSPDNFDLDKFKEENFKCVSFKFERELSGIDIGGVSINAVHVEGDVYLETLALTMPSHLAYIEPDTDLNTSCVIIQKFNFGDTKIINSNNNIVLYLDLSKFNTPPYWKFSAFEMNAHRNNGEYFTLRNAEIPIPIMFADDVDLTILSS